MLETTYKRALTLSVVPMIDFAAYRWCEEKDMRHRYQTPSVDADKWQAVIAILLTCLLPMMKHWITDLPPTEGEK